MKYGEKCKAIELRRQGKSYKEIAESLSVSKGTLSLWLKNVELTEEQKSLLKDKSRNQGIIGGQSRKKAWQEVKDKIQDDYEPPLADPFFMLGLGVYLGEGSKYSPCRTIVTNSDGKILKIFIRWITTFFVGDFERFSVGVHHHSPNNDDKIKEYWSKELGLPVTAFIKSNFSRSRSSNRKKGNLLPFGTVQITARGKGVWKIRQKIEKAMLVI